MEPKTGVAKFSAPEFLKITQLDKSYLYHLISSNVIDAPLFRKLIYIDVKKKIKN